MADVTFRLYQIEAQTSNIAASFTQADDALLSVAEPQSIVVQISDTDNVVIGVSETQSTLADGAATKSDSDIALLIAVENELITATHAVSDASVLAGLETAGTFSDQEQFLTNDDDAIISTAETEVVTFPEGVRYIIETDTVTIRAFEKKVEWPSMDTVITGQYGGSIEYSFGMRLYDKNEIFLRDISDSVENISLSWDEEQTTKMTVNFETNDASLNLKYDMYVEPYATVWVMAGLVAEKQGTEYTWGRFTDVTHKINIGLTSDKISFTARDKVAWLMKKKVQDILVVGSGVSYATTIRQLCIDCGFRDQDIVTPASSVTVPTSLVWETGTSFYEVINRLADAINWQSPYVSSDSKLVFEEILDLSTLQPAVQYASDEYSMIVPDILHSHDDYVTVNRVTIAVDDALRAPFTATYTNNNIRNPHSYTNTGEAITLFIENLDHLASQSIADARARLIMQREGGAHSAELKTWLDVRRKPHEMYNVYLDTPATHGHDFTPHWYCIAWKMEFQTGGTMTHRLKEIVEV